MNILFSGVYDAEKGTAFTKSKTSCCLLGLRARAYQYQPIADLKSETDFQVRMKKTHIFVSKIDTVHSESDPELSTGDTQAIVFVFQFRRWKHVWWKQTRSIMRILAQHDSTYATESEIVKSPDEVAAL